MNKQTLLSILVISGLSLGVAGLAVSDSEKHEREGGFMHRWFGGMKSGAQAIDAGPYVEECGSCHFPYQPGLLPAQSWEKIMSGLEDHFGENAELSESKTNELRNYLLDNAAGRVNYGLPNKIASTLGGDKAPLRITETPYFRHEHREIPLKMVRGNEQVRSFSQCDSCHTRAMGGNFDERSVRIPGYGRWDD